MEAEEKRGRGRPKGSRNRPPGEPMTDYPHADPDTIIARQMAMLEMTQQSMRAEIQAARAAGQTLGLAHISALEKLSNAIVRAIDALRRSADLADELASRLTPEQLLEAAIKKIEGQDLATVRYAIKRLRAHQQRLEAEQAAPTGDTAADAIAGLV